MDYMTISEAATKWNLSNRRIQTLCSQGRIPGAERAGIVGSFRKTQKSQWMPE